MPESTIRKISKAKFLRKYAGRPFMNVNQRLWDILPAHIRDTGPFRSYGSFLHFLVKLQIPREQNHGTHFLRNRPELELLRRTANQSAGDSPLKLCVLGCSNGAEVYSILWVLRSARSDLQILTHAIDISPEILDRARQGLYSPVTDRLMHAPIFERLTPQEMQSMFESENGRFRIRSWISQGTSWRVGSAADPDLANELGPQDIVVANKFLCHMTPPDAEKTLRNIANLVRPGGYLFVSGIDLDVRTKVALDLGWTPIPDLIEEMHDGDPSVRRDWPWQYWGLEPFDRHRRDWRVRYASAFRLGSPKVTHIPECVEQGARS